MQGWDESQVARDLYASLIGGRTKFQMHPASKQSVFALVAAGFGITLATASQAEVSFPGVVFKSIEAANASIQIVLAWLPGWVIGAQGGAELVNYRVQGNHMIVDRSFAAAELRVGGDPQQALRIVWYRRKAAVVSDAPREEAAGPPDRSRPRQEMRLRSGRAPVTRLSRKVLIGLSAAATIGIGGAFVLAVRPQRQTTGSELYNTSNRMAPDGLCGACRNPFHSSAHRFPAILGKPIANAGAPAPGMPTPGPDAEQQRIAQEQEAARTSHLFATTNVDRSLLGNCGACRRASRNTRHGLSRSDVAGSQARVFEDLDRLLRTSVILSKAAGRRRLSGITAAEKVRAGGW